MSERLSDEEWLDRSLGILNAQFKKKNESDWTLDDAVNLRGITTPESLQALFWAIDPEEDIAYSKIPQNYFRFRGRLWMHFFWIFGLILLLIAGVQLGILRYWWAIILFSIVVILLDGATSYLAWFSDKARAHRQNVCTPLTLPVLLRYRKPVQSVNSPPH